MRLRTAVLAVILAIPLRAEEAPAARLEIDALLKRLDEAWMSDDFAARFALFSPEGRKRLLDRARLDLQEAIDNPGRREAWAEEFGLLPGEVLRMTAREFLESRFRSQSSSLLIRSYEGTMVHRLAEEFGDTRAALTLIVGWRRIDMNFVRREGRWWVDDEREPSPRETYSSPEAAAREWCEGLASGGHLKAVLAASRGLLRRIRLGGIQSLLGSDHILHVLGPQVHLERLKSLTDGATFDGRRHAAAAGGEWTRDRISKTRVVLRSRASPDVEIVCVRQNGAWRVDSDSLLQLKN